MLLDKLKDFHEYKELSNIYSLLNRGRKQSNIIYNIYLIKLMSRILMSKVDLSCERGLPIIDKLQEVNILELGLVYKSYDKFAKAFYMKNRKDFPSDLLIGISEVETVYRRNVEKGSQVVNSRFGGKHLNVKEEDYFKWNYSRFKLLERISVLKFDLLVIVFLSQNGQRYSAKKLFSSVTLITEDIETLMQGGYNYRKPKEKPLIIKLNPYLKHNHIFNKLSLEYKERESIKKMISLGIININDLTEYEEEKLIKLKIIQE